MLCVRCGSDNPVGTNYCTRCNARLPRMAPTGLSTSVLDVQEGRAYVVPTRRIPTKYLHDLTCRAYEYVHEEGDGEAVLAAYEVVRSNIESFEYNEMPDLLGRLHVEAASAKADDDYFSQLIYLLNKGVATMREGFALMDAFVESGDVEVLREALKRMQDGNDDLALGKQLSDERAKKR